VAYPGFFRGGGGQQIQLMIECRENGGLSAVAPLSGVPLNLQMSETRILIRLLRVYFPRISEFGSASEFRGGGGWTPKPPPSVRHWYPLHRKMSGPQGRSGPTRRISSPPASRSLVAIRLRYIGPHTNSSGKKFRLIIIDNKRFR
jgi:hypothetical protein